MTSSVQKRAKRLATIHIETKVCYETPELALMGEQIFVTGFTTAYLEACELIDELEGEIVEINNWDGKGGEIISKALAKIKEWRTE